jgi:hypothetical protein
LRHARANQAGAVYYSERFAFAAALFAYRETFKKPFALVNDSVIDKFFHDGLDGARWMPAEPRLPTDSARRGARATARKISSADLD